MSQDNDDSSMKNIKKTELYTGKDLVLLLSTCIDKSVIQGHETDLVYFRYTINLLNTLIFVHLVCVCCFV